MSISSVTQSSVTQVPPPPPQITSLQSGFQLASASSVSANPTGSTNPYQAFAADLQSSLLNLQEQGSGTSASGTQTDAVTNGQTIAQAHHYHHHQAQGQPQDTSKQATAGVSVEA